LPEIVQRAGVTLVLFLGYELGYWSDHFLKHRIPALWELHKVHHTAEVLTPLMTMHPLDTFIFGHILAMTAAVANGLAVYAFGDTTYQIRAVGDQYHLGRVHPSLRAPAAHACLDRVPRRARTRVLKSPHHQIHHSTNPVHFNKNLGSCLALWD
jgi:sterol desaturase/sphingolipid hydroxylase (fatty acid hydroxylase superfamily)